jgi:hypothetical protein
VELTSPHKTYRIWRAWVRSAPQFPATSIHHPNRAWPACPMRQRGSWRPCAKALTKTRHFTDNRCYLFKTCSKLGQTCSKPVQNLFKTLNMLHLFLLNRADLPPVAKVLNNRGYEYAKIVQSFEHIVQSMP